MTLIFDVFTFRFRALSIFSRSTGKLTAYGKLCIFRSSQEV